MNGSVAAPTDSAYATLACLTIVLPLTQAAVLSDSGNSASTVIAREIDAHSDGRGCAEFARNHAGG